MPATAPAGRWRRRAWPCLPPTCARGRARRGAAAPSAAANWRPLGAGSSSPPSGLEGADPPPPELAVLALVGDGLNDEEIGERLGIAPTTAQTHRSRILQKLQIKGTPKLVAFAIQNGFTRLPSRSPFAARASANGAGRPGDEGLAGGEERPGDVSGWAGVGRRVATTTASP